MIMLQLIFFFFIVFWTDFFWWKWANPFITGMKTNYITFLFIFIPTYLIQLLLTCLRINIEKTIYFFSLDYLWLLFIGYLIPFSISWFIKLLKEIAIKCGGEYELYIYFKDIKNEDLLPPQFKDTFKGLTIYTCSPAFYFEQLKEKNNSILDYGFNMYIRNPNNRLEITMHEEGFDTEEKRNNRVYSFESLSYMERDILFVLFKREYELKPNLVFYFFNLFHSL